jgi:hypothetical protein
VKIEPSQKSAPKGSPAPINTTEPSIAIAGKAGAQTLQIVAVAPSNSRAAGLSARSRSFQRRKPHLSNFSPRGWRTAALQAKGALQAF